VVQQKDRALVNMTQGSVPDGTMVNSSARGKCAVMCAECWTESGVSTAECWTESGVSVAECQSPECLLLSVKFQNVYC